MITSYKYFLLVVTGLVFVNGDLRNGKNCTDIRIHNGPFITPCLREIVLQKGENITLTCKGTTKLKFRQQDLSEEVTSNFTIINTSSKIFEEKYTYQTTLDLYNVDQFAIGYYACTDDSVDSNIVNSLTEEPENNEHVAYIYVYVNGTGSLFAPMMELIMSRSNKILIECRPTTPDIEVELSPPVPSKSQNKTPKYSPKIGFILKKCGSNAFKCQGQRGNQTDMKRIRSLSGPPKPHVIYDSKYFLPKRPFTLNCSVDNPENKHFDLKWKFPNGLKMDSNEYKVDTDLLSNNITIYNASEKHAGVYTCEASNSCSNETKSVTKEFLAAPILNMTYRSHDGYAIQNAVVKRFLIDAYPEPIYKLLKNGKEVPMDGKKYKKEFGTKSKYLVLTIEPWDITDNANMTLIASNGETKNVTFELQLGVKPSIAFGVNDTVPLTCIKDTITNFKCDVTGFRLPNVTWVISYKNDNVTMKSTNELITSVYAKTAYLRMNRCDNTGTITCQAANEIDITKATRRLLVYEINNGFGIHFNHTNILDENLVVLEKDSVTLRCLASVYEFSKVTWLLENDDAKEMVEYADSTEFSHVAVLKINNITLDHAGEYRCEGERFNGRKVYDDIQINVLHRMATAIQEPLDVTEDVYRFEVKYINCMAIGAPLPEINWYKDDQRIIHKYIDNVEIYTDILNRTAINSTVKIIQMQDVNIGKYNCEARSNISTETKSFMLNLKVDKDTANVKPIVITIVVIIIMMVILIAYLVIKIKKEKRFRKELAAAGLKDFEKDATKSLNPDLGIDEQAELLPYDKKFEFPMDKLLFGKQLGAGAFGVVYKAEARGILNAEETTPVAVKMVKKTADNMYIKALVSELKIMVHLGKHINIVNLLGACTKNVGKRELVVIVEYCKYGNIHNYMQRHRDVFIDQLDTDNKEKQGKVNRAYTSSSCGSTGVHSDYFGSTNTQETDHTTLNTANTVRSVRKNVPNNNQPTEEVKASEGYVQPEWRSNYESDYNYDGRSPRPLTSRDLLAWAFQIARGMEYLASRKVLHGDLAARNILLADDNVVKICDFGLAKSIYKNDDYQAKQNSPLPVKWLAIECMTDRIFSTQSDVWSFGIVLWELFSLAKTPYPNLHPSSILQFLSEGHRLDKPSYADDRLYDVMNKCWEAKATARPTFSQLQELLGTFLEDNVRDHYVDLNSTNMDSNNKAGQKDYLAMVSAPDYNNLVTPSPHHYVNTDTSFFPLTPVDGEGYLQMSPRNQGIFSPRDPSTEFTFDPQKFNPKTSESSSCGSELTPMLTLNNLPARSGSESDHEGNIPYLSVCPPIEEEADEVFVPSLNDTKNAKNIQQSAVTNPTYITFENFNEKPKDNINNYVNVPNGLVNKIA